MTWLFQILRVSGANLIGGYADLGKELVDGVTRAPDVLTAELGNSFWSIRQPNGYSERKADWISTEHLDRRMRIAEMIARHASPKFTAEEIIDRQGFSDLTRALVARGTTDEQRFVLLACSPEMMEV